jgi:hypothetical protein
MLAVVLAAWSLLSLALETGGAPIDALNFGTLLLILVGCIGLFAKLVSGRAASIWNPLPWFLLTSALYYGFGPLLYFFSNDATIRYANAFYSVDAAMLRRVTVLISCGLSIALAVYATSIRFIVGTARRELIGELSAQRIGQLRKTAVLFIAVGLPVKLFLVLPRSLGIWDVVLPGFFEYFSVLTTLALIPLALLRAGTRARGARVAFLVLLAFEIATAFLLLSKFAILKVAIALALGWVLTGVRVRRLFIGGVLALLAYGLILSPLVTYGRLTFGSNGLVSARDAAALVDDFSSGATIEKLSQILPGVQSWWTRLNYANAEAFAINAFDAGQTGDTFELALWTLVPRVLFPEKPITTSGNAFNLLATGSDESQSAPGMFAEGYWNAGWIGLLIVSTVLGVLMAAWEAYTQSRLSAHAYQYVPVMWMGVIMGVQHVSWFVPNTIGLVPFAIAFHFLLRAASSLGRRKNFGSASISGRGAA